MGKSAQVLGQEYGLTAQEMNLVLKKEGFLDGKSGDYMTTDKGANFADEKDFHRGTGGYTHYNRHWTTRVWDESIKDELNVTEAMKESVRSEVAETRRKHSNELMTARAKAESEYLEKSNSKIEESNSSLESSDNVNIMKGILVIGGVMLIGYGFYKAAPRVVKWWNEKIAPNFIDNKSSKIMICPSCGDTMLLDENIAIWNCTMCNYSVSEIAICNGEVFWYCDKCEDFLNTQDGFKTENGSWICSRCGFDNETTDLSIDNNPNG